MERLGNFSDQLANFVNPDA